MKRRTNINAAWFLILLAVLSACRPSDPFERTLIAENIVIPADGSEVVLKTDFVPSRQVAKVCFEYVGALTAVRIERPPSFSDGTELQIAATITSEAGRLYRLDDVENSVDHYLCIRPSDPDWLQISKTTTRFTELRISSSRSLNVTRVEWVAYNSWDL